MSENFDASDTCLQQARYVFFKEIAEIILEETYHNIDPIDTSIQILSDYLAPVILSSPISRQQARNKLFKEIAEIILEEASQSPYPLGVTIQILSRFLYPFITSYDDIKHCYQAYENALKLKIEYLRRQPPKDYLVELNTLYETVEG